jgi:hypothetical protein
VSTADGICSCRSTDTDHSDLVYRATYRFVGDSPREIGFDIGDREIARLDDVLDVLAAGVERGAFPMRPGVREYGAFKNCRFCDFARCCPGDRDGFWETAQTSPELAAYSELIDPSEFGGRDDEEMSR